MAPTARLAAPPREVPAGLKLRLFAHYDVVASLMYFVPAAALAAFAMPFATAPRIAMLLLALVLLALGLQATLASLLRSARLVSYLEYGIHTVGRIVAARFAWDRRSRNVPYAELLADWPLQMGRSQMRKFWGCFMVVVLVVFLGPFLLFALVAGIALILGFMGTVPMEKEVGYEGMIVVFSFVGLVALAWLWMGFLGRLHVKEVERYMQWRKIAQPGRDDQYDDFAIELVEQARRAGRDISLKEPLPKEYGRVDLVGEAEYSMRGERVRGEGRVRFTAALDPSGVEPLLFLPDRPGKVVFLAGLPPQAAIDERGRWKDVPAGAALPGLLASAIAGLAALAVIAMQLPWLASLL